MSFFSNIMQSMKLNQDDDYDLDDDYDFSEDVDEEPQRTSIFPRRPAILRNNNEDTVVEEEEPPRPKLFPRSQKQLPQKRTGMEVTMIKPTSMDDSRDICDYLLSGKAVVLNMEGLHMEVAQRIIDFTSGAAYSMEGNLQKISNYIFIATPEDVELSGDFQNILAGNSDLNINSLNLRM